MADEDATNGLGFGDPSLGFIGAGSVSVGAISAPPTLPNDDLSGAFLDTAAAWDLAVSPPDDSYDISTTNTNTRTTAPSAQPGYVSPSWQDPSFDQQQLSDSSVPNGFGLPNNINPSVFGSGLEATERGTALPASKPPLPSAVNLTPAMHEKLRNIAMPPHLHYGSPKSASSPESAKTGAGSSPDASSTSQKDSRKRKVSADFDDDDVVEEAGKPVKKTAHNMIEKRYRTNINDKIAALRDSVPSLRIMCKSARGEDTTEDREELHGLTPAHKLNKATVLSKATEYIRHLEKRNNRLLEENGAMHARIAAFEKLFLAGAMNGSMPPMQQPPTPMQYPQDNPPPQQLAPSPLETPRDANGVPAGMIDTPEEMKRIISAQMAFGQPYPVPQQLFRPSNPTVIHHQQIQRQPQGPQNGWSNASPYLGKLMVGSLAGLMILEAVRESETSNEDPQGRGLFALPLHLLSSKHIHIMGYDAHISLKFLLLLGVVLWAFIPSLFSLPQTKPNKQQAAAIHTAPSPSSPIHVRRRAWLTAVQTVWVPHHNFFLEAAALLLKTLKLSLRNAFGPQAYQAFTGVTPEQEAARVKAWSIALDSQLAGGDVEICTSRLVLTLLASGTLPDTPIRLMLKALHVRVLLWDLGHTRVQLGVVNAIATKIARARWNEARQLNQLLAQVGRSSSNPHEDELPDHLAELVERDCDEVLSDAVIQRAHNLAFNVETTHNIAVPIDGMDAVVDDATVRSPMDAIAAWWSTELLHDVLTATLDKDEEMLQTRDERIALALKVAPIGSYAQARATLARAVLVNEKRGNSIKEALEVLGIDGKDSSYVKPIPLTNASPHPLANPIPIVNPIPPEPNLDFLLSLRCAMVVAHLRLFDRLKNAGSDTDRTEDGARLLIEMVLKLCTIAPISLLGFTSVMELMEEILANKPIAERFSPLVERLAAHLRLWIGSPQARECGMAPYLQDKVITRCLAVTKSLVGMEVDTGYGTMVESEDEECEAPAR